jgi:hypothetical protein
MANLAKADDPISLGSVQPGLESVLENRNQLRPSKNLILCLLCFLLFKISLLPAAKNFSTAFAVIPQ